jgi:hypothetical protein
MRDGGLESFAPRRRGAHQIAEPTTAVWKLREVSRAGRRSLKRTGAGHGARPHLSFAMREFGKMLALFGGIITILGLALWSGFGAGWLGRLPGDIRVERGNSTLYFPLVTCLILSILLSLILSFFRR